MDRLYERLVSYSKEDYYPMHMPGHKRNTGMLKMVNPYSIDITEIEGFDNLHQAQGILKQLSDRLGKLYHAGRSFPLVNGSTAGILAGISAAARRGDKVLIARNCHKAVYHAVLLRELNPVYCYPQQNDKIPFYCGINAREIEDALIKHGDITLVVITSPTYEGVVSDIKEIADTVHRYGAILLVDEAHGAHFGFHESFPKSAVGLGADIVIQSLHKTLPAFTQTSVLHVNRAGLEHRIEQYLAIYESSSPSYLLMAGIDRCIGLMETQGKELFDAYDKMLKEFYLDMRQLKNLTLAGPELIGEHGVYDLDPSKITVLVQNTALSGHSLQTLLREKYHIIMEMEAPDYVLGMTSICDTKEGFHRLADALLSVDGEAAADLGKNKSNTGGRLNPMQVMLPWEVAEKDAEQIRLEESSGRVSAAFISMFPPGSPLLVPGERIGEDFLKLISRVKQSGITITGLCGKNNDEVEVVSGSYN